MIMIMITIFLFFFFLPLFLHDVDDDDDDDDDDDGDDGWVWRGRNKHDPKKQKQKKNLAVYFKKKIEEGRFLFTCIYIEKKRRLISLFINPELSFPRTKNHMVGIIYIVCVFDFD